MIVAMQPGASEEQIQDVIAHLVQLGFEVHRSTGARQTVLGAVGARADFDIRDIEVLAGVQEVHRISAPYKLAASRWWSWPGHARSNRASSFSRPPSRWRGPAPACCAAAHLSRVLRPTPFRVWERKD